MGDKRYKVPSLDALRAKLQARPAGPPRTLVNRTPVATSFVAARAEESPSRANVKKRKGAPKTVELGIQAGSSIARDGE